MGERFYFFRLNGAIMRISREYFMVIEPGTILKHYIYIYHYMYHYIYIYIYMVSAGIIERKLRSTKVRLFTVPCCSIILFSSEGVKKNVSEFTPNFFRRSIILVGALLFYNSVFPHFSHISHFRSIINVSRAPFYN